VLKFNGRYQMFPLSSNEERAGVRSERANRATISHDCPKNKKAAASKTLRPSLNYFPLTA